jgi:uncharacterized membrane protein YoaK (UPF0700 family)
MLSAEAYSFRQKSRLAISLSWVAGYTNIVALLVTSHVVSQMTVSHMTVSHMTGNTTVFSSAIAARNWKDAEIIGAVIGSFFLGAILSSFITETARRRGVPSKYVLPMAVEAVLLAWLGVWLACATNAVQSPGLAFACIAALAMGLQNATITRISDAEIRTTHVTGVITDLGLESVQFLFWWRDKIRYQKTPVRLGRTLRLTRRHPTFLRLLLLASILGSFGFGAIAGTIALAHLPRLTMLAPVLFLLWIILVDWRRPIADVHELDLFQDTELKTHGILKEMLPSELGIYRISQHRAGSRPPHFRAWAERIPHQRRIIILALSPITPLTDNAVLDLLAAAAQLRSEGRILILANLTARQFKVLHHQDGERLLGQQNIAPDLEFAVVRALAIIRTREINGPRL